MARTPSTMVPLGTPAPDFRLPDTEGGEVALADLADAPALLVMFICNHCPYVVHIRERLAEATRAWMARGVAVVAINANDVERYPDDAPDKMRAERREQGYAFPYLFDATQEVALAYRAACTPDFFLYDADRRLAYRGRFDGARPGSDAPVTGADLDAAVEDVLAGRPVRGDQLSSLGCNIKWTPDHVTEQGIPLYPPL